MQEQITTTNNRYMFLTEVETELGFENVLNEAIENVFASLSDNKQALYRHLETNYRIRKEEIPFKIEEFVEAIDQIFGISSKIIQIRIIERLHANRIDFSYSPIDDDLNFLDFVLNLKHFLSLNYR